MDHILRSKLCTVFEVGGRKEDTSVGEIIEWLHNRPVSKKQDGI